jgi:hypothetical protein
MLNQNNRVLGRVGARLLTEEEVALVKGVGTTSGCVTTGGIHGTPSDINCEDI